MSDCTCDTDPLFYWVYSDDLDLPEDNEINTMCKNCCREYLPALTFEQVREQFNCDDTTAFDTLEAAQLYIIKRRL